ncbi:hypothetical protein FHS52_000395 [Erythromicrobium ramosum]|uniref:Uncharacterized protein n=1 Tax=Erythrobacter ramosus TaxID=35811 RepID=A0ABR6HV50_9SPHN|nr:hypothetical protein [Erythrobacter ramosus]
MAPRRSVRLRAILEGSPGGGDAVGSARSPTARHVRSCAGARRIALIQRKPTELKQKFRLSRA